MPSGGRFEALDAMGKAITPDKAGGQADALGVSDLGQLERKGFH